MTERDEMTATNSESSTSSSRKNVPRNRKRSLFGKASKPSIPQQPVPSLPSTSQHTGDVVPTEVNEESLSQKQQSYASTMSSTRPGGTSHKRSPSSSLFSRKFNPSSSGSTEQQKENSISSRNSSSSSNSLGRKSINNAVQAPTTPSHAWYQRVPMAKAIPFTTASKSLKGRDRSASVGNSPQHLNPTSPTASQDMENTNSMATSPSRWNFNAASPTSIRRSFSRRSVVSLQGDSDFAPDASAKPLPQTPQKEGSKRRFLGKSNSKSNVNSFGTDELRETDESTAAPSDGFLRRVGSKTLLRGSSKEKDIRTAAAASNDSLASTSTSNTSRGFLKSPDLDAQDAALSAATIDTLTDSSSKRTTAHVRARSGTVPHSYLTSQSNANDGIPKRLSGWLMNMINNEVQPTESASTSNSEQDRLDSNDALKNAATSPRSRTAGLLSALSSSSKGRLDSQSTAQSSNSVAPARSGLDRALRYFLDSNDRNADLDAGIWLLGIFHPPMINEEGATAGAQDIVYAASPIDMSSTIPKRSEGAASSSKQSDQLYDDASSLASGAQRTRETSPSITSQRSSIESQRKQSSLSAPLDVAVTPSKSNHHPSKSSLKNSSMQENLLSTSNNTNTTIMISADKTTTFQADFGSRIWCTYRSHFSPIARDGSITVEAPPETYSAVTIDDVASIPSSPNAGIMQNPEIDQNAAQSASQRMAGVGLGEKMGIPNLWNRATAAAQAYGLAGRSGLTTDAGWGCMLRTGQSLLANALLNVHLGRQWCRSRKPLPINLAPKESESPELYYQWKEHRQQYSKYTQILSWFMDEPSKGCPFSVHRMAREGKRLGKEVGEWFGPSTAAGAIKKLVDEFSECGIGVSVATDAVIYLDLVQQQARENSHRWERPVLILIGVRLGLDGVHPMYYDSVKATFSFPQSVGIAGGRPSSSYYFVGFQGNSLFYLDPHQVRSSVQFRKPPATNDIEEWYAQAYSEADLATYHNEKPRRMPTKSLDPSMLLGFLITGEDSMNDFCNRVKSLPRPIFSVLDSMPLWMKNLSQDGAEDAEEKAIESISEGSLEDDDDNNGELSENDDEQDLSNETRMEATVSQLKQSASKVTKPESGVKSSKAAAAPAIAFPSLDSFNDDDDDDDGEQDDVVVINRDATPNPSRIRPKLTKIARSTTSGTSDVGSAWEEVHQSDVISSPSIRPTEELEEVEYSKKSEIEE